LGKPSHERKQGERVSWGQRVNDSNVLGWLDGLGTQGGERGRREAKTVWSIANVLGLKRRKTKNGIIK